MALTRTDISQKEMIQIQCKLVSQHFFCQTKYSLCEDLGRVAEESPGALTTPMRQFVGTPDLSILSKPAVGSLTINHPGHVAWKFAHWGCLLVG